MASEVGLKLVIGAALAGSFQAILGGAKKTVADLGAVAERLQSRHERLGDVMARAMARPARPLGELRRRYEALGRTLEQVRQKTEALNRSIERGAELKAGRDERLGAMRETAGAAVAVGAPVMKAVVDSARFGDAVKDIAITGGLDKDAEARLGASLRKISQEVNQSALDMAAGVNMLIANGMDVGKASEQAALLGKFTTATRASFDDAAKMMVSFDTLGVSAKDMELAFSQAAAAGKMGSFEVRDMAKWFPQLGGLMKGVGVTGTEAVVSMASRLQIAMKTAGSTDEAANNLKNFLAKLTSKETTKAFNDAGVDLQGSMLRLARQGMDPIEGAVGIVMAQIGKQSPAVAAELKALGAELSSIKDPAERAAEMERRKTMIEALGQRAGMGELFTDLQAVSYLLAEVQNRGELGKVRAGTESGRAENGQLAVDVDFGKRMTSPLEQFKALQIGLAEIGLSIGTALLPPLLEITQAVAPVIKSMAAFAQENPLLVKTVVGVALALTAGKLAVLGLGWAINFMVLSPLNGLRTVLSTAGGHWLRFKGLLQTGAFTPLVAQAKGVAPAVGGVLKGALMTAGRAVMWLGRAVTLNPIGLALTAAALLVYKFWGPISGFFKGLWAGLKAGLAPIGESFKAAFARVAPVLKPIGDLLSRVGGWFRALIKPVEDTGGAAEAFGVRVGTAIGNAVRMFLSLPDKLLALPGEMARLGGEIVSGLVNGINRKFAAAGEAVASVGASVRDTFKDMLGIRSPSRVFAEMGGNLSEGLALGMGAKLSTITKAAAGMAAAASVSVAGASVEVPGAARLAAGGAGAQSSGMVAHYAPVLTINATSSEAGAVRQEAEKALAMSLAEFEKMMRRYEAEKIRRAVR